MDLNTQPEKSSGQKFRKSGTYEAKKIIKICYEITSRSNSRSCWK